MNAWKRNARFLAAFLMLACACALPAAAAEPGEVESPGIPAYAIGRLKVLAGTVYARTPDSDWQQATTNTPLKPDSRISVPEGSEAELQFHGGQFVLLTSGTDVEIPEMSEEKTRFRLRAGEIRFDLPGDDFAPVGVRVPGGARTQFNDPGRYWLTVTDEDTTRLVVRRGKATVTQEGETTRIQEGQEATIGRTIAVAQYEGAKESIPEPTPLSSAEREAGVPPVVSYELRDYGEWVYTPSYGYAWRPRVATGWSPYTYGRWDWVNPYGWTWVSYEPWGWYPYYTGYWVSAPGFGWVWTPYGSFVSVGFAWGWGSYPYYYNNGYHHHHGTYYRPSARFIPESRNGEIRWAPMRPGERYRQPEVRPNDRRLTGYNRPLESGRVFVSERGATNSAQRQWRDVQEARAERQKAVVERASTGAAPRKDTRHVRPEMTRPAPPSSGQGSAAKTYDSAIERRSTGDARPSGTSGTRSGSTSVQGVPPRSTTSRDTTIAPKSPSAPRSTSPAPSVSPSRDLPSARDRATIPPVSNPAARSYERSAPSTAPAREAPSAVDRGIGAMERPGGGFDRGGGGGGFGGFESRGGGGGGGTSGGGRAR